VVIHRVIYGSLERFIGILIEHYAGAFPFWLSPVQVKILPIGEAHLEYASEVASQLRAREVRVELDDSGNSLGKKIASWKHEKVPYSLVIGDKEVENNTVTLESRDDGKVGSMSIDELFTKLI